MAVPWIFRFRRVRSSILVDLNTATQYVSNLTERAEGGKVIHDVSVDSCEAHLAPHVSQELRCLHHGFDFW